MRVEKQEKGGGNVFIFCQQKKVEGFIWCFSTTKIFFLKKIFFVYICVMDENINEEYTLREYLCISSFLF